MRWSLLNGPCLALALFLCAWLGQGAQAARRPPVKAAGPVLPPAPSVELAHLTTHDTYTLRPDPRSGRFSGRVMKSIGRLLACHHTGKRHVISRRLVDVLYATARHFHSAK